MNKPSNNLEDFIQILKTVSLSEADKASLRTQIADHIEENAQPVPSRYRSISILQSFGRMAAATATILFLLGGVSLAAEDSLPGSLLYPVKTNINESFLSLTAFSEAGEAQTQSELAARRIKELQTLARQDKLTANTSDHLIAEIEDHTQLARTHIASLNQEGVETSQQATKLSAELTSLLAGESNMLKYLAEADPESFSASTTRRAAAALVGIAGNQASSSEAVDLSQASVKELLSQTASQLSDTYSLYQDRTSATSTNPIASTTRESLLENITSSARLLDSALVDIKEDELRLAVSNLKQALRSSNDAWVQMTVEETATSSHSTSSTELPESTPATTTDTSTTSSEDEDNNTQATGTSESSESSANPSSRLRRNISQPDESTTTSSDQEQNSSGTTTQNDLNINSDVVTKDDQKNATSSSGTSTQDADEEIQDALENARTWLSHPTNQMRVKENNEDGL